MKQNDTARPETWMSRCDALGHGPRAATGLIALALGVAHPEAALAVGPITIPWFTLDSGGGALSNGSLRVTGTMSQWDGARRGELVTGSLRVTGGFWGYGVAAPCLASYNNDGVPGDVLDFLDFIDDFGACESLPPPCGSWGNPDVNGDTIVDVLDFLDFLDSFGTGC